MKFRFLHCLLFVITSEAQTRKEIHCATISEHVVGWWIRGGGGGGGGGGGCSRPRTLFPDLILLLCIRAPEMQLRL
jgi:hypothetical protein